MPARRAEFAAGGPDVSDRLAAFVDAVAADAGLAAPRAYWLRLAVDELVTNVAEHGYRGGPGSVRVEGDHDRDEVWVRIEDDGPVFSPDDAAAPTPDGWDDRPPGGFGLMLVRDKTDRWEHVVVDGRNRNTVALRRGGAS